MITNTPNLIIDLQMINDWAPLPGNIDLRQLNLALIEIIRQYFKARKKFAPLGDIPYAMGVLLEEWNEVQDEQRANDLGKWKEEVSQLGAMSLGALMEVKSVGRKV